MDQVPTLARLICGRRTKWLVVGLWLVLITVLSPLAGKLVGVQKNDTAEWLPRSAESTQVTQLQKKFQATDTVAAVILYERTGGTTPADETKARADIAALTGLEGVLGEIVGPLPSDDRQALQVVVPLEFGSDGWNQLPDLVDALRDQARGGSSGLMVYVAGPASFYADSATAFAGIDGKLLLATVLVVVLLLLAIYRSPVLWILPVMCAFMSLSISQGVIYLFAAHLGLTVNGQSQGILTVLVFGAATDYALLLISRYREELHSYEDRHQAMGVALSRTGPAIIASAATVSVGMLCLTLARMNSTKGLGPVVAIGIVVGLLAMITLMPALLVIFGRWLFWPVRPQAGTAIPAHARIWGRLGGFIANRARVTWIATTVVLLGFSAAAFSLNPVGFTERDSFTNNPPSVAASEALARHFQPGQNGETITVIGSAARQSEIQDALARVPGIDSVGVPVAKDALVRFDATFSVAPDSDAAKTTVTQARDAVHAVDESSRVGGQTAMIMDMASANRHDNRVIIPLVLLVILIILVLLLRAIVAPVVLILTVVVSYGAALGISTLIFQHVLGFDSADSSFPLIIFVFLVALGVDYNIFLMTRIQEQSRRLGTRPGTLAGLTATGGVITSAGLVLAATFAAFASIPIVAFTEIGVAVAIGVLLDTFVVRSILVTALTYDLGDKVWWPSRLGSPGPDPVTTTPDSRPQARIG